MTAAHTHPEPGGQRTARLRVLVAFEDVRRAYREAIALAIGELRPALEVRPAALADIGRELGRFDPHVVVSSQAKGEHPGGRGAWVHIPTEDGSDAEELLARVCVDGRVGGPKARRWPSCWRSWTGRRSGCAKEA